MSSQKTKTTKRKKKSQIMKIEFPIWMRIKEFLQLNDILTISKTCCFMFSNFLYQMKILERNFSSELYQFNYKSGFLELYILPSKANSFKLGRRKIKLDRSIPLYSQSLQFQDKIFITGGYRIHPIYKRSKTLLKNTSMLNKKTGILLQRQPMGFSKRDHFLIGRNNSFFLSVGGADVKGLISIVEEYNIKDNFWQKLPSLNEKKRFVTGCAFNETIIYIFGGCLSFQYSSLIECFSYKFPENGWKIIQLFIRSHKWSRRCRVGCIQISNSDILLFHISQIQKLK